MTDILRYYSSLAFEPGVAGPFVQNADSTYVSLASALGLGLLTQAQTRYVSKGGSDVAGDGSLAAPFATVEAANVSIADASAAKPYAVNVGPGIFTEVFTCRPFVSIVGTDKLATVLSPVQGQWLHAAFAGAAVIYGCISDCTIGTNFTANFAAVGNTGAAEFYLEDCCLATSVTINVTGNGVSAGNRFHMQNCEDLLNPSLVAAVTHTFADLSVILSYWYTSGNNLVISNASNTTFTLSRLTGMCLSGTFNVTNTGASTCGVLCSTTTQINAQFTTIVGTGARLTGHVLELSLTAPDADTTFDFSTGTAAAVKLVSGGFNYMLANPTANRTFTWNNPALDGTRVRIKNISTNYIAMSGSNIGIVNGPCTTYLGPFDTLDMWFKSGTGWMITNLTQQFTVPLVNGVSAFVPCDLSVPNAIVATLRTWNGAAGVPAALSADRIGGFRASTGGFKISSINPATGAVVATDQGTYDVIVRKP